MSGRLFIGGRSTQPEIDALSVLPIAAGGSVTHDEVARIAGVAAGSTRFQTVVQRWRRLVERNSATRVESRDRVFYFLRPDEAHDRTKGDLHRIGRATGRLHARVGAIDTQALTGERKAEHGIMARETAALLDSARRTAKAIQGPKPTRPANLRLAQ
jgi:hypothetical protein